MAETTQVQLRKLGMAVREARRDAGFSSQETFGEAAGVADKHMGAIERGEVNLTYYTLAGICRALRVRPSELFMRAKL